MIFYCYSTASSFVGVLKQINVFIRISLCSTGCDRCITYRPASGRKVRGTSEYFIQLNATETWPTLWTVKKYTRHEYFSFLGIILRLAEKLWSCECGLCSTLINVHRNRTLLYNKSTDNCFILKCFRKKKFLCFSPLKVRMWVSLFITESQTRFA
jgi:hypothetical protein